jgi:hypothetical protein
MRRPYTYDATINYDAGPCEVGIRETGPLGERGRKIEHAAPADGSRV